MNILRSGAVRVVLAGCTAWFGLNSVVAFTKEESDDGSILYVGTYSNDIVGYRFNPKNAKLEALGPVGSFPNASSLTVDRTQRHLFAVSEIENGFGEVGSFLIDAASGKLKEKSRVSSEGLFPCHLTLAHNDKVLVVANYGEGNVSSFEVKDGVIAKAQSIGKTTGSSVNKSRQEAPHAHQTVVTHDGELLVPDLGLDQIRRYKISKDAQLTVQEPIKCEPGIGPRHLTLDPAQKFIYIMNELKSEVTVLRRDDHSLIQKIATVPQEYNGFNYPAGIELSSDGRFLYTSNRLHDSLAVFSVNQKTAQLDLIQIAKTNGSFPRGFKIDPSGKYLVVGNQKSNEIQLFSRDQQTGQLAAIGAPLPVEAPVAFEFIKARA